MLTLQDIANGIREDRYKRIAFMVGAGISTSAGIPDFRSPETGLYANLERLDLPYPEAVFDIDYFKKRPEAFYTLADGLYPGKYEPTKFHKFMKLLQDKGLLYRVYTQNIDTLERLAGVEDDKIVEAHGSFAKNYCISCHEPMSVEQIKKIMWADKEKVGIPRCQSKKCKVKGGGLVKPSIVFFGEQLPQLFYKSIKKDFPLGFDLVIVAGTSLMVQPFANLPDMVDKKVPRVLFNLERVGGLGRRKHDVLSLGSCDEEIEKFCSMLGWSLDDNDEDEVEHSSSGGDEDEYTEASDKTHKDDASSKQSARDKVDELAHKLADVELDQDTSGRTGVPKNDSDKKPE